MEIFKKEHYRQLAATLAKKLQRRNFDVKICENAEEAKAIALEMISPAELTAFGGSLTLEALGIIPALKKRQQPLIDRDEAETLEERHQMMRESLLADIYLTSVNGISQDGVLVNVDSVGNRVAALTYGPKKVLVFAGMNKIYGDVEHTVKTVRGLTAPQNARRLDLSTPPCIKTGLCGDCLKEECICSTLALMRRSKLGGRITIFLILEDLGL